MAMTLDDCIDYLNSLQFRIAPEHRIKLKDNMCSLLVNRGYVDITWKSDTCREEFSPGDPMNVAALSLKYMKYVDEIKDINDQLCKDALLRCIAVCPEFMEKYDFVMGNVSTTLKVRLKPLKLWLYAEYLNSHEDVIRHIGEVTARRDIATVGPRFDRMKMMTTSEAMTDEVMTCEDDYEKLLQEIEDDRK